MTEGQGGDGDGMVTLAAPGEEPPVSSGNRESWEFLSAVPGVGREYRWTTRFPMVFACVDDAVFRHAQGRQKFGQSW